jgi:hypothetical protein
MPPDSSEIDQALIARLAADTQLLTLMPNGVYYDLAPQGSKQFVIVSILEQSDARLFGGRAFEDALYLVKAVEHSTVTQKNTKAAAARIDALLEEQVLTVAGYSPMALYREERVRVVGDEMDPSITWTHRGGHYRVVMST